jgi:uncharacterized integral membrane protein
MSREPDDPPDRREGPPPPGQTEADRKADQQHLRDLQRARQGRVIKVLAALALAVILLVFITQNSQEVPVDFVFFTRRPALIWVMFICSVVGGLIGYLIGRPGKQVRLHRRREDRDEKKP